jgi:hypothetical protein
MEQSGQLHLRKEPPALIRGEFGPQVWWERRNSSPYTECNLDRVVH